MSLGLSHLIERRIREAQVEGKFEELDGQGRPLPDDDNPFADPEWRLAYKVMRNAGLCPPWMDLMKEIDAGLATVDRMIEDYRAFRRDQMTRVHRSGVMRFAELVTEIDTARDRALARIESRWREIDRQIAHLNATVPVESLKRMPVQLERRMDALRREFPLLASALGPR